MNEENYNWTLFYTVLGEKGPDLLIGIEKKSNKIPKVILIEPSLKFWSDLFV